ncbi:MAG: guanylate kinase [Lachnospiraceae bacterium]|nr:guanylate kinase [Lachnospiraceae bacterium]
MIQKGVLLVVSGFSGAGKGTVVKKIMSDYDNYSLSISMTTRSPREGEVDGREYFFVTKEKFEEAIDNDELLEHACYVSNYYGTPRKYVEQQLESGKDVILEIETNGALQIKKKFPEAILIFVTPPSAEVLHGRLAGRGTETAEVIAERMKKANEEALLMQKYDYILVNDELNKCVENLNTIISVAHQNPKNNEAFIETIKKELEVYK